VASPPHILLAQDSQLAALYLYNATTASNGAFRLRSFYVACYNILGDGSHGAAAENCTFSVTSKYSEAGKSLFQTRNYVYSKASATKPMMQTFLGPNVNASAVYFALVGSPAGTPLTGSSNFFVDNFVAAENC